MKSHLLTQVNNDLKNCQDTHEKFMAEFKKNPNYALGWSEGVFRSAAKAQVLKEVKIALEENSELTVAKVKEYAEKNMLNRATHPARSTSATRNLVDEYELVAWSELVELCQKMEK